MTTRPLPVYTRALALVMVIASVSCGGASTEPPVSSTTVAIRDNAYMPDIITVAAGTRVRWVNNGVAVHDMTHNGGAFSSGDIAPGGSYERVVEETFDYACTRHSGMQGAILVQ